MKDHRNDGDRFLLRFAIPAAAIIVALSLLPEALFDPMNLVNAGLAGGLALLQARISTCAA